MNSSAFDATLRRSETDAGRRRGRAADIGFENGLDGGGKLNAVNYWNWRADNAASYGSPQHPAGTCHKWGGKAVGGGAEISFSFDPGSKWSAAETAGLKSAMQIWSDEANIRFVQRSAADQPNLTFYRAGSSTPGSPNANGRADTVVDYNFGEIGAAAAGECHAGASVAVDTSVFGGPGDFSSFGGYGVDTFIHEIGHVLGLGHAGPYNGGADPATQQFDAYDNRLYSIMSYINPWDARSAYYKQDGSGGTDWGNVHGYKRAPYTPMMDDILAIQQLYGPPTSGALTQTQIFGFGSTIKDATGEMFDFTRDRNPVVTLFDTAENNELNLSGFASNNDVNLNPNTFSSVDGMRNNIAIANGTRIDRYVGGAGNDVVTLNHDNDYVDGGGGINTVVLAGKKDQYRIERIRQEKIEISGNRQRALLGNVQWIEFADGSHIATGTLTAVDPTVHAASCSAEKADPLHGSYSSNEGAQISFLRESPKPDLASNSLIDGAYHHLLGSDQNYSHNSDIANAHIAPLQQYGNEAQGRDRSAERSIEQHSAINLDADASGLDAVFHHIRQAPPSGRAALAV